ncbi:xaa-Pro aminopeptidase 1-like isoform X7 [Dreissena polymorpha]|uniref:xaa-Pro aminopeptidase 1-like isoform X6 n=1 Tax=Dreissena polymorpha TaxID=45954 RepID=UPI002264F213|nr:xaa-Pro aminopeptidase 1-like isoform X6 [Dreissena polymorpha]XP_052277352.1 xaa-Pro aminopeptidase 1-like isoform X7 [Dreissena polymorpha]
MGTYVVLIASVLAVAVADGSREKREGLSLEPGNWPSCQSGAAAPRTRVDTRDRVAVLRQYFATAGIQAYLVPSEDAHQSEYPSGYDKRRGYISGFTGSAGFAVVTIDKQALWTDGRYFLEAEDSLDCNWILMRQRETGVPTMVEWLKTQLSSGNRLGASPFLVSSATWKTYSDDLKKAGLLLVPVENELIDTFWQTGNGRPPQPDTAINALQIQFAGVSWQDKVNNMRTKMTAEGTDMLAVTALDETAWLFNLRASDIDYNPFFLSYAIIDKNTTTLYILNHTLKLTSQPTDNGTMMNLAAHLNTNDNGTCTGRADMCVEVKLYDQNLVKTDVNVRAAFSNKVWLGYSCNQAIYSAVPEGKILQKNTPIATTKTKKNPAEVEGMKKSHIRDAVALISFLEKLEREVKAGQPWTELSAANDLKTYRYAQQFNRGLSFTTISSSGSNGAIIHYSPSNMTDKKITTSEVYLLDSGGQYLDGTTDVTRTFHFGTPTAYQKECYTRVLMAHINLFQAIWQKGVYGREIDAFARAPLWDVGLVYRHGTGHGIGMFLSVHEGPGRISLAHDLFAQDNPLDEFQFFSDEPGYYEAGQFGMRLENIVMVKNATTKYRFPGAEFLTFEHVTLVPYAHNLIDYDLLSEKQINYLNAYNNLIREKVGPELKKQGRDAAYEWMMQKTEEYTRKTTSSVSSLTGCLPFVIFVLSVVQTL